MEGMSRKQPPAYEFALASQPVVQRIHGLRCAGDNAQ